MSMNSLKEVSAININGGENEPLIKEKKRDPKLKARRALTAAVILTTIFMIGEVYGGYKAGSLAIMTDAAHLMTDIGAMLLSLFSMWLASRPPTAGMSFGFHRAEILGALASVLTIWALTGILVYEGINRVMDPEPVDGKIMFIVASGGLLINILDAFILHAGSVEHSHGGIGHGHSHGGGGHGHSHGGDEKKKKKKEGHSHDGEKKEKHGHSHDGDDHGHSHGEKKEKKEKHGHSHDGEKKEKKEKHGHSHDGEDHGHSHGDKKKKDLLVPASSEPQEDHGHSHGKKKKEHKEEKNINVYSAFVHVIGDCVQSVGVMIASALIWWQPSWKIADPIVTFVFSAIVLVTTVRLLRQSISVLMEGVPQGIDASRVQQDLESIHGVGEIHDLHIWAITVGQPALSVHLILNDPTADSEVVLNEANHMLKDEHNIVHTTIQIEKINNKYCENMDFHSANTRS